MIIHTVKSGDTVFTIARKYAVSPTKIIENNCLLYPERLIPGQQLLILTPTRTYVVRGGDTVSKVCRRFDIKKSALLSNNPSLHGRQQLHAGTELSIHYDVPIYGAISLNGYIYANTSADRFYTLLPYLTYVTFHSADDVLKPWLNDVIEAQKIPLLRITWSEIYSPCQDNVKRFLYLAQRAQEFGFRGVTLTTIPSMGISETPVKFLLEIKKQLLGMDMLLFQEVEAERCEEFPDAADGIVALYEKCQKKDIPTFEEGERKVLENFADRMEAGKTFVELSSFGYDGEKALTMDQILKIGTKYRAEFEIDREKLISHLDYNFYKNGQKRPLRIHQEILENVKAKLELMHELGYMGVAVDVGRVPISYVMMLHILFSGTESSYMGIFGA